MKTSVVILSLALALSAAATPVNNNNNNNFGQFGGFGNRNGGFNFGGGKQGNNGGNKGGNQGNNGGKQGNNGGNNGGKQGNNGGNNGGKQGNNGGNKGGNQGGNGGNQGGAKGGIGNTGGASVSTTASTLPAATGTSTANNNNNNANTNNANNDPQTSLTLDPRVIAKGFANDGQDVPTAGQIPSLTSTNNFINFCLTVPQLPLTNGKQITTGSCNPAPIGVIPSVDNMPSAKFVSPKNGDTLKANTQFTVSMAINNLVTGNFVNAQENYFAAPQTLNGQGQIIGHTHHVIEAINSLDSTTPTDPRKFAFFKGVNSAAVNGIVTSDVTAGVPSGFYRLCSINSSSNHQPVIVPIAQHGSLDDCVYFTVTNDGKPTAPPASAQATTSAKAVKSAAPAKKK